VVVVALAEVVVVAAVAGAALTGTVCVVTLCVVSDPDVVESALQLTVASTNALAVNVATRRERGLGKADI
jgi:integral membrane sensor domain MASE1